MKILNIYSKYKIPQNLREHMLRVAALAKAILKSWTGSNLDKQAIIKACALHDIAKPMNFDLKKQKKFGMTPKEIRDLEKHQKDLKQKYGNSEHQATINICKDLGCSPKVVKLAGNLEWKYIPKLLKENDIESLLPIYCDMRIGPNGLLSVDQRLNELKKRVSLKNYESHLKSGKTLEQKIKKNTSLDLDSIRNEQVNSALDDLMVSKLGV
jgi:putative nucleotidyltransferase with HDIG domain